MNLNAWNTISAFTAAGLVTKTETVPQAAMSARSCARGIQIVEATISNVGMGDVSPMKHFAQKRSC